jgi:hypothetical protein
MSPNPLEERPDDLQLPDRFASESVDKVWRRSDPLPIVVICRSTDDEAPNVGHGDSRGNRKWRRQQRHERPGRPPPKECRPDNRRDFGQKL